MMMMMMMMTMKRRTTSTDLTSPIPSWSCTSGSFSVRPWSVPSGLSSFRRPVSIVEYQCLFSFCQHYWRHERMKRRKITFPRMRFRTSPWILRTHLITSSSLKVGFAILIYTAGQNLWLTWALRGRREHQLWRRRGCVRACSAPYQRRSCPSAHRSPSCCRSWKRVPPDRGSSSASWNRGKASWTWTMWSYTKHFSSLRYGIWKHESSTTIVLANF